MEDVTRKRVLRLLEGLPEDRLYQVLDFIEFLEQKEAREAAVQPDAFQRFAERVEDQMRLRSVAPKAMKGTMRLMSTAGRVVDGVRGLGHDLVAGWDRAAGGTAGRGEDPEAARAEARARAGMEDANGSGEGASRAS